MSVYSKDEKIHFEAFRSLPGSSAEKAPAVPAHGNFLCSTGCSKTPIRCMTLIPRRLRPTDRCASLHGISIALCLALFDSLYTRDLSTSCQGVEAGIRADS